MKEVKKHPKKQLERYTVIFMQIGLVWVLFMVHMLLEYQTTKELIISEQFTIDEMAPLYAFERPKKLFAKTKEVLVEKPRVKKTINLTQIKVVKKPVTSSKIPTKPSTDVATKLQAVVQTIDKPVSYSMVEKAPIFKGCDDVSEQENKWCLTKKMTRFVQRQFNSEIAQDIGLPAGKYKMYVQFVIDVTGQVTAIRVKAAHRRLEDEGERVVSKMPVFTPGKQEGVPVPVQYTLPITFVVD